MKSTKSLFMLILSLLGLFVGFSQVVVAGELQFDNQSSQQDIWVTQVSTVCLGPTLHTSTNNPGTGNSRNIDLGKDCSFGGQAETGASLIVNGEKFTIERNWLINGSKNQKLKDVGNVSVFFTTLGKGEFKNGPDRDGPGGWGVVKGPEYYYNTRVQFIFTDKGKSPQFKGVPWHK